MSLLQQLANLCQVSLSINSLDSPPNITNEQKQQPLFYSVFAKNKTIGTKQSKSIEKIKNWTPTNDQQLKEKKMWKLTRTISKKITNNFYHFWVHFEEEAKKRKKGKTFEKVGLGLQKLITFVTLKNTKSSLNFMISEAFTKISKNSSKRCAVELLQKIIVDATMKQKARFLKIMSELEKMLTLLDMFCSTCQSLQRKTLIHSFYQIKSNEEIDTKNSQKEPNHKISSKANDFLNFDVLVSNPIKISNKMFCTINKISLEQKQIILSQKKQTCSMSLCKSLADSAYENFPQTCNNVLFFEKLCQQEKETKISFQNLETATKKSTQDSNTKTRKSFSHLKNGAVPYHSPMNQTRTEIQQEKSKQKIFSNFSDILNLQESRIQNLEKKLFGQTEKKQSKYRTEGEVWISDRETFAEILSSLKSQSISLRNSRKKLEVEKDKQITVIHQVKCRNSEKKKQKDSLTKVKKPSISTKNSKEGNLGPSSKQKLSGIKKMDKVTFKCKTTISQGTKMGIGNSKKTWANKQRQGKRKNEKILKSKTKIADI